MTEWTKRPVIWQDWIVYPASVLGVVMGWFLPAWLEQAPLAELVLPPLWWMTYSLPVALALAAMGERVTNSDDTKKAHEGRRANWPWRSARAWLIGLGAQVIIPALINKAVEWLT